MNELKLTGDVTAISTALLAFFQAVPWPSIAAFTSFIYILLRIYYVLKNKGDRS